MSNTTFFLLLSAIDALLIMCAGFIGYRLGWQQERKEWNDLLRNDDIQVRQKPLQPDNNESNEQ